MFCYQHLQHTGVPTHTHSHTHNFQSSPVFLELPDALHSTVTAEHKHFLRIPAATNHNIIFRWSGTGCKSLPVPNGHQIC